MSIIAGSLHLVKRFVQLVRTHGLGWTLSKAWLYFRKRADVVSLYHYFKFVVRSSKQWKQRLGVARRFIMVHKAVDCLHTHQELLYAAEEILRIPSTIEGDIIECGAYAGGSTCKLSIVAKLTGRKLIACDSFAGVPVPKESDAEQVRYDGKVDAYKGGEWSATLDKVQANIRRCGELDSVLLVPGWFHETLPSLAGKKFVCIILDVDLSDSIVCCLKHLWPALQPGCKLFTHEAGYKAAVAVFRDEDFWKRQFGHAPPLLIGAERGLSRFMPHLGYIQKPL